MFVREFVYWRLRRPAHKAFIDIIWRLPRRVVYWCVVRAAVKVEPNTDPSDVTAAQMLEAMK